MTRRIHEFEVVESHIERRNLAVTVSYTIGGMHEYARNVQMADTKFRIRCRLEPQTN